MPTNKSLIKTENMLCIPDSGPFLPPERKPERNEKKGRNSGKNGIGTEFRPSLLPTRVSTSST